MDWFSWLLKTGLDPPLVYEYGLAFSRNELQCEDIAHFNHEFLQSMGIAVAKHRLEILKLAKKENESNPRSISRLFVAITKTTKKSFGKYFSKFVLYDNEFSHHHQHHHHNHHHHQHNHHHLHHKDFGNDKVRYNHEQWKEALLRKHRNNCDGGDDGPALKNRALALSGPLDSRVHERLMTTNCKNLKLSGPLDGKVHERLMNPNRSPRLNGPGGHGPISGRAPGHERLMITTTRSPRLSGPLDGRAHDRVLVTTNKVPKSSGPLDGRVMSPRPGSQFEKERVDVEYDEHSLWTALFHDMKPT